MQNELLPNAHVPDDALDVLAEYRSKDDGEGKRGLKLLVEMIDVVADDIRREIGEEHSDEYAVMAVSSIARYFGGRMAYLPAGKALNDALRNREMWKDHNRKPTRDTVLALAKRYQLTEARVYQILEEQRSLYIARVQHGLFD
jgi:Mor family transcriptional regulator